MRFLNLPTTSVEEPGHFGRSRLRLQLRWKRKILNTTGFLFVPLIKGKLKNKNLKINELCPVRQVGYCSKFVLKSWKPTFLVFYWSWSRQTKNRADKKQTGSATLPTTAHKLQAVWRIRIKIIRIWFRLSIFIFQILTQILLRLAKTTNFTLMKIFIET